MILLNVFVSFTVIFVTAGPRVFAQDANNPWYARNGQQQTGSRGTWDRYRNYPRPVIQDARQTHIEEIEVLPRSKTRAFGKSKSAKGGLISPGRTYNPKFFQPIKTGDVDQGTLPIRHKDYEIPEDKIISLPVGRFPEPTCQYSVLKDSLNGRAASLGQVNIGDRLFHRWRCFPTNSAPDLYCISVTSCTVSSGQQKAPLIDEKGCSVEPLIVPHVEYNPNDKLDAWIEVNAFRLIGSDATVLNFHCQINILIKENGQCPRQSCSIRGSVLSLTGTS